MPKSKKKKRQDFQKVKLKVGKRLPKGDNVTNLSFKTRQIQLTQRIKDDSGQGLVTKNKQSAQELLRQCDHHSSSSRLNAVMGLRELWMNNYADMMVPTNVHGYATLLKKLSSLLIDNEATVRHAVVNLFKIILHKITKDSSAHLAHSDRLLGGSLFAHLHAFLCCAMNHIHEDIRLDALLLYDALLETCPALVVQQTGGLLRNLVGLLATPSQFGSRGDATTQRLSLNPESRLPVVVFRVRVLSRIKRTLMAALDDSFTRSKSDKDHPHIPQPVWSLHNDHHESRKKQSTMIVSSHATNRFSLIASGSSHELDDYITNPSSLESFIHQCMPVLSQCWKEARADSDTQNESVSMLTSNALEVISLVVSVIQLLFVLATSRRRRDAETTGTSLVPPEVMTKNYLASLEQLMMAGFPYSAQLDASAGKKKAKKKKDNDTSIHTDAAVQASVTVLNLGICDIMSGFCTDHKIKFSNKRFKKISHHIILAIKDGPNVEQCRAIVRVIENVFSNPQTTEYFTKVYRVALKWYLKAKPKSAQKKMLYDLFESLGRAWDGWSKTHCEINPLHHYTANEKIEETLVEFFQSLPQLALTVHSLGDERWTLGLLKLMCHGHVRLHGISFDHQLNEVLDPAQGLFTTASEQIQQQICAVISRGTLFSKENLRQLLNLIRCPPEKPVLCGRKSWSCCSHALFATFSNIRECVPLRSQLEFNQMSKEHHQQLSDYLRFLFSLLIGFTGEDLDNICPKTSAGDEKVAWFSIDFTVQEAQWERHLEIASIVAREIAGFSLPAQPDSGYKEIFTFISNFEHFWTQTFSKRGKMHVLSVIGLSHLVLQASQPHRPEKPGQELITLASLSLASLLAGLNDPDIVGAMPSSLSWQIKAELTGLLTSLLATGSPVLERVMELLASRATGAYGGSDVERQAAKSAQDFLLTDESLRHCVSV